MASVFKRGGKHNRGGSYYIQWYDHHGKRQSKSARTTDKATAERIAAKLEADAALRRDGVIDPTLDEVSKESCRRIEEHLANYEAKLIAAARDPKHISSTISNIRTISKSEGFTTASDITADGVNLYASRLKDIGRSARTIQAHLTAIKSFTKWLVEHDKIARDPLSSVKKPNPKADRRKERRMLLHDEWHWLRSTTALGPIREGMSSMERVLLYAVAIQTGLRSSELRSITRNRLYLDGNQPSMTCKARSTKNKKDARRYIQPSLAADLLAHVTIKSPKTPVFDMPHRFDVAEMFRADVAAARKAWIRVVRHDSEEYSRRQQSDFLCEANYDGEILDFHSLRHTCGAWLAMSGAHPKAVQAVMRHSTITLTMDTYGHLFPGQEAETIAKVPEMLGHGPDEARATGTDHAIFTADSAQHWAQQLGRESTRNDATLCEEVDEEHEKRKDRNLLEIATFDDSVQNNTKRRARDSNPQPLAGHLISNRKHCFSKLSPSLKLWFHKSRHVLWLVRNTTRAGF
jgi:integrase